MYLVWYGRADVILRCATLIYLSSFRGFWRASLSGFLRKEFATTADEIWRDWFQQNHYWQPWEEEIITTLTSFDHRYSYSQNVSVDRTIRWQAPSWDKFALVFSPLLSLWTGAFCSSRRTKWGLSHGTVELSNLFWLVEAEKGDLMMGAEIFWWGLWVIPNL